MKKTILIFFILIVAFVFYRMAINGKKTVKQTTITADAHKMEWWEDAKFGMFIHWGIYSVPAGKWGDSTNFGETVMFQDKIPLSTYKSFANKFNPKKFNAEEWVKLAREAGQKYIVIVSKHHDGFANVQVQCQ